MPNSCLFPLLFSLSLSFPLPDSGTPPALWQDNPGLLHQLFFFVLFPPRRSGRITNNKAHEAAKVVSPLFFFFSPSFFFPLPRVPGVRGPCQTGEGILEFSFPSFFLEVFPFPPFSLPGVQSHRSEIDPIGEYAFAFPPFPYLFFSPPFPSSLPPHFPKIEVLGI